jgi:gamma-glutamyltranspeptidase
MRSICKSNTTTFHILDQYGNGAAVTTSLGGQFLVVGDTGIHINERLRFLSLEEGKANELAPGYKVRHTSNPYMVLRGNRPYILGGNTGIDTQPQGQLQQFINVVEFGMTAQEAVDRLRFVSTSFPASSYPHETLGLLQLEEGFPSSLVRALRSRGHDVTIGEGIFGVANMLVVNEDGTDAQVGAEPGVATASGEAIPAS